MDQKHTQQALGVFFAKVQLKAIRQAQFATGSFDEAEDLVQDAMVRISKRYAEQPESWDKLFHRILQNLIRDWYRKSKVRNTVMRLWVHADDTELDDAMAPDSVNPDKKYLDLKLNSHIQNAIADLPLRQQQAFLYRSWWNFDVQETANAMGCGEGSVKTHYHRAIYKLRDALGEEYLSLEEYK